MVDWSDNWIHLRNFVVSGLGLKSFAKPDMAIDARSCVEGFNSLIYRQNFLCQFCKAMTSSFSKLSSRQDKLWIVVLLLGALQLVGMGAGLRPQVVVLFIVWVRLGQNRKLAQILRGAKFRIRVGWGPRFYK